ncbi:hypothetical protein AB434_1581 [Heyndrickxia coagulans]|uniref:Uncharacterized protein n=1 Tax=Heyndrickxia coagulans TaxID=1398 RepID=A0AAN0T9C8_HEYCO|nr:hypothetical protein SB48_HM08orf05985 [Heyndrickxia coagulans]AKN53986.1 hypothetical protein AB434_1581 [Heyndrickxia coagulans]OZV94795.1 hypothetical protein CAY57_12665 [Heyndrickxia coagulans]
MIDFLQQATARPYFICGLIFTNICLSVRKRPSGIVRFHKPAGKEGSRDSRGTTVMRVFFKKTFTSACFFV